MADKRKAAAEAAAATAAKAEEKGETKAEGPPAKILDSLEEDDEFEEFENQSTTLRGLKGVGAGGCKGGACRRRPSVLGAFSVSAAQAGGRGASWFILVCSLLVGRGGGSPSSLRGFGIAFSHCSIESACALQLPSTCRPTPSPTPVVCLALLRYR